MEFFLIGMGELKRKVFGIDNQVAQRLLRRASKQRQMTAAGQRRCGGRRRRSLCVEDPNK